MRVRLFTFRFSPTLGAFDDSPLQDFTRDKEVLAFREHFFVVNEVPHLACVVTFQESVIPASIIDAGRAAAQAACADNGGARRFDRGNRPDPTAGLGESDRLLFNTLRTWRATRARKDGVPHYVVFTNRELLQIVATKPDSLTALGHVEGVGASKIERYGPEVLAQIHGAPRAAPPTPAAATATANGSTVNVQEAVP